VRDALAARGLPAPGMVVAGVRWQDCGKLDYAWGGAVPVVCLTGDPREYGMDGADAAPAGANVLIIAPATDPGRIRDALGERFHSLTTLAPAELRHGGRPVQVMQVYLGLGFRA
jgi:hypothetical protein